MRLESSLQAEGTRKLESVETEYEIPDSALLSGWGRSPPLIYSIVGIGTQSFC